MEIEKKVAAAMEYVRGGGDGHWKVGMYIPYGFLAGWKSMEEHFEEVGGAGN